MNEMLKQFNLPRYIDGLSFADASKKIQSKFKERNDPESVETEKEMLGRLKQMQEHVKERQEEAEQPERSNADLVAGAEGMPMQEEAVSQQFEQEQEQESGMMDQIQNAYGGSTNQFQFGGAPIDPPKRVVPATSASITGEVTGLTGVSETPHNANMNFDTKQIVRYQPGVVSGKTGKSGFYLYSKNVSEPGFNVERDREFVNQEEITAIQRTPQWKAYAQTQKAFGGSEGEEYDPHAMPDTAQQRFAPTIKANDQSIFSSLASIGKSVASSIMPNETSEASGNKMYFGGPLNEGDSEYYANNNPLFMQNQPAFSGVQPAKVTDTTSPVDETEESGIGAKVSEGIGAASAAYSLGKQAFGKTGIDTSGATKVEPVKTGNAIMSGAAKGAQVGSAIGKYIPIPGAGLIATAATGVIGAGLGLIGANKQKKAAEIANRNSTYADAAVNDNQFKKGGKPDPLKAIDYTQAGIKKITKAYTGKDKLSDGSIDPLELLRDSNYTTESKLGLIKMPSLGRKKAADITKLQRLKLAGIDTAEAIGKNKDALRYAPALGNMLQLSKLKKPDEETTGELSTRYKPQFTDEAALANLVREETNSTREAILGSSEGSGGSARASLLGAQLNSTKALSDAYMRSAEQNNAERRQEQTFNLGIDTTNLQQQNMAQEIRAKNKGTYDTEKSRLMSAIATDLGSIGQEELYKKFPELMGADYNFKGKYKKRKEE